MVNAFCSLTRLALSLVAIKNFPGEYFISTIFPGIGDRLICTSKGDKKMLTTVGASASAAIGPTRVTRPSAGETTTSGSDGGTRFGSRKKNAIKSVNRKRNPATHQKPKAAAATASSTGTTIYGILSLTMLNSYLPNLKHLFATSVPLLWLKRGRNLLVPRPLQSFSSEK